jgi:DNA processing protein
MTEPPTPRQLLVALHAGWRQPPGHSSHLVEELTRWARAQTVRPTSASPPAAAPSPAPPEWLEALSSVGSPLLEEAVTAAAAESATAAALGARIVTLLDPDYPELLAATALPPPALVVRGLLPPGPAVAIVGSRLADAYGREVAGRFARYLAAAGVVVVSGMARGVDAAAHQGALAAANGRTLAVLGCGMGVDYPRGRAPLSATIAGRGGLVSEFPCAAAPRPWHFPLRNRTIAGLAAATLVVQATPRSGSLVTARHARHHGRPVFAVPGPVFEPLSWGPHALLRRGGALLAGHPQDLLDLLPSPDEAAPAAPAEVAPELAAVAEIVLAALRPRAGSSPAAVAARAGLPAEAVLAALLELEVAGRVERLRGMAYRLARSARPARANPPAARPADPGGHKNGLVTLLAAAAEPVVLSALRAEPPTRTRGQGSK